MANKEPAYIHLVHLLADENELYWWLICRGF